MITESLDFHCPTPINELQEVIAAYVRLDVSMWFSVYGIFETESSGNIDTLPSLHQLDLLGLHLVSHDEVVLKTNLA
jgi:hypothetical protein